MTAIIRIVVAASSAALTSLALAGSLTASSKTEIELMLTALKSSGCQFYRNGNWYSGAEAQAHLLMKLSYLDDKNLIKSAEEFIELGASTSSASGKPYQVRCGKVSAVDSKQWLQSQLKSLRATKP
jgi:Family of unknown function (DUF5329)